MRLRTLKVFDKVLHERTEYVKLLFRLSTLMIRSFSQKVKGVSKKNQTSIFIFLKSSNEIHVSRSSTESLGS